MANRTKAKSASKPRKPEKPYPDFPLFPHATKRWAKKIRGKLHYFGSWADGPQAALERFNREWPYLSQGRTVPPLATDDVCTLRTLCNSFLSTKQASVDSGELSERSFRDYYLTCANLIDHFGKERRVDDLRPDDFQELRSKLAERLGVVSLRNEITRCRSVFKYAHDQRLVEHAVNYGQSFSRPSAKMLRRARNQAGSRMFEADECRRILNALDGEKVAPARDAKTGKLEKTGSTADPVLRAMVLLALNAGFGNTDIASLPQSAVDLDAGWIDFPRPKTEIPRRVPLWTETIEALRKAIPLRPTLADRSDDDLCFLTSSGRRWVRTQPHKKKEGQVTPLDILNQKFARLLKRLEIDGHRNFYALRHSFETAAGESKDQVAVNAIMGHVDDSMAAVYRERVSDERLRAVVAVVRGWLWPQVE